MVCLNKIRREAGAAATALFLLGLSSALGNLPPKEGMLPNFDKRAADGARKMGRDPDHRAALEKIKAQVPDVQVELDAVTGAPTRIHSPRGFLSGPEGKGRGISAEAARAFAADDPHRAIKAFLNDQAALFGHDASVLNSARVIKDYVTAHNGLHTVIWQQHVDDIPVFEAVLTGHTTRNGELTSLSSHFVPAVAQAADKGAPNRRALQLAPTIPPEQAVVLAAGNVGEKPTVDQVSKPSAWAGEKDGVRRYSAPGLNGETQVKLTWLPMNRTTLTLCWEVILTSRTRGEMFRVLIDAQTGEAHVRHCLTAYISDATYRVYTSDSPSPLSPGHATPLTNQPPLVPRVLIVTNAVNTNASPLGWINDGVNTTMGNNVDAHLDRDANDSPDLPRTTGSPFRVFDFPLDLNQAPTTYGDASVAQLFYWCNYYHDKLYELGFTEAAGNFQVNNFGRGGAGGDAVQADAQDGSGTDNANFSTPPDGSPGRMQMYTFTGPSPDRDGDLDAEIIFHEHTHGLSGRLVGGGVGISALQTGGMGEGWSDWYALTLLSEPGDNLNGNYAAGGYVTYLLGGALTQNYYYGIRRYPYTTDLTKNPLTFKDIDPSQASSHPGVPKNPVVGGGGADEVHNQGEVWCVTLWEARVNLINKLGYAAGNQLILQLVTDGMKLGPANPNFLQARDAIILADQVNTGGANFNELWAAFAKRGMGASATSPSSFTTAGVHESFDVPDDLVVNPSTGLIASGPLGGPFSPASQGYTLTNISTNLVVWTATIHSNWLTLSNASGTLAPGAPATTVRISVNAAAQLLPMGIYADTLLFTNQTTSRRQSREILLRVGQPDFFTELFEANDNDLAFQTFTFKPDGSAGFYSVCREVATNFPTDPAGGLAGPACDDCFTTANLSGTNKVSVYGTNTGGVFFIGSNGYLTLRSGDSSLGGSFGAHFNLVRVSALYEDLNPGAAGSVSWKQLSNRVAVTWSGVPQYGSSNTNNFQIEMFFDGTIRITYLRLDARNGLVGLSAGRGVPLGFQESDFASYGPCILPLIVTVPASATEGDGILVGQGRVRIPAPLSSNLTVTLVSSDTTEITVPASVVLPTGTTNATFDLTLVDDGILDGTQSAVITGSAPGYGAGTAFVLVHDRQMGSLALSIPASATEGDPPALAVVFVSEPVGADTRVELSSSDPTEIQVPPFVVVPAGEDWAMFNLTIVDDTEIDGPKKAIVRAHVMNWLDGASFITVRDNETTNLMLTLPAQVREGDGVLIHAGQVRLSGTLPTNLVVSLLSSDTTEVTVPPSVTILAGQVSAAFNVTIVDDPVLDGTQMTMVTASATGFNPGSASIAVQDDEIPPVPSNPHPADLATNVPANTNLSWSSFDRVSELVANGGFETGDFTGWVRVSIGPGDFIINDGTVDPTSGDGPLPPYAGSYSALGTQAGPGPHSMYQVVAIPANASSAVLSWAHRLRNFFGGGWTPDQQFRVEIQDTNGNTLAVAFVTQPGDPLLGDWVTQSFDVSSLIGQTVRLAFIVNPNGFHLDVHLDNVSVVFGLNTAPTTFDVYFGTNSTPGPAEFHGSTTNTAWDLPLLEPLTTYYWQIVSHRLGTNVGPVWRFTTRGVHHLDWSAIASPQILNQPFGVTLTAKDDFNTTVSNFTGTVNLSGLIGASSPTSLFVNGDFESGDFTGWIKDNSGTGDFVINNGTFDPSSPDGPLLPFSGRFSALTDQAGPGVHALYQEVSIPLDATSVLLQWADRIRNHAGEFQHPNQEFRVEIRGPANDVLAIAYSTNPGDPLLNDWVERSYDLSGFRGQTIRVAFVEEDNLGNFNLHLDNVRLIADLPSPVAISPTHSGNFTNGAWTGTIAVQEVANGVHLQADDGAGHTGQSNPFDVLVMDDIAVTVVGAPNPVAVGAALTYTINVLNSGPSTATGVNLTNFLPANASLVSFVSSRGSCSNVSGKILCGLGSLAGGTNATVTIVVRPTAVGSVTNIARVSRNGADPYLPNNTAVTVTIVTPPLLSIGDASVAEGNVGTTNAVFKVILAGTHAQAVTVSYATADGTARAGVDYFATNGTLTFGPSVSTQTVTVRVIGDTLVESNETFVVNLSNPTNAIIGHGQAVGTILNDDGLPGRVDHFVWDIVPSPQYVKVPFPVTISAQDAFNATVTNFTGSVNLSDLDGLPRASCLPLTPPNPVETGGTPDPEGGVVEPRGAFITALNAFSITSLGIEADLTSSTLTLVANIYSANGLTQGALLATSSRIFDDVGRAFYDVPIDFTFTAGVDYDISISFVPSAAVLLRFFDFDPVTFNSPPFDIGGVVRVRDGEASGNSSNFVLPHLRLCIPIPTMLPAISPTNSGNFSNGVWTGNIAVLAPTTNIFLVADDRDGHAGISNPFEVRLHDDIGVGVTDAPDPVGLGETLTYTIVVTNIGPSSATGVALTNVLPASAAFVSVVTSQGACSNVGGIVICGLGTLAADTNVIITVVVTPAVLGNITNQVTLSRAEADTFPGNNSAATVTRVQRVSLSINDTSVVEGDSGTTNAVFAVQLSPVTARTVRVNYATANGTAVSGSDYLSTNGTLIFMPGETNKTVTVAVRGDIVFELHETFLVNLSSPSNAVVVRSRGTNTILNDDPFPSLSISDAAVAEGNVGTTHAVFMVRVFPPSSQTITVQYNTADGSATAGSDYVPIGNGSLTFNPGQTNATLSVTVNGDTLIESDETFFVFLLNQSNANIGDEQGIGTILNDDGLPGQIDHFVWDAVPSPQYVNLPFAVRVTAQDAFNTTVTNFTNSVALSGSTEGGTLSTNILGDLASSSSTFVDATIGYAFTPNTNITVTHVRHQYGSRVSLWTDGGVLLASRSVVSTPGTWLETLLAPPMVLQAGVRYRVAAYTSPGGGTAYYRLDGVGTFKNGTIDQGYSASFDNFPGNVDGARWSLVDLRYTIGTSAPLAVTPVSSANFTNGVWTGNVAVLGTGTHVQLKADDRGGHLGFGNPFNVFLPGDLSLSLSDSPDPVGTNSLLTYTLTAFNPGPAAATGVVLSNFLPAGVTFISAAASQGTCSNAGSVVRCDLGTLAAASNAIVQIFVASPLVFGDITNRATVTQSEADPNPTNNSAIAITSVPDFPPIVSITSPSDGSVFQSPTNLVILAAASDTDGTVTKVEFFNSGVKLGEATNNPFTFTWTNAAPGIDVLTAKATDNGGKVATSSPITITVLPPPPGNGIGVYAEYFDNINLTALTVTQVDPEIDFDQIFGNFPPPPLALDTFSVRWTGAVEPLYSDTYTFYTVSDDGVRLYINGQLIINNFSDHPPTENSGAIALQAGQRYSVRMEYYQNLGGAVASLSWSSTNQFREIIPQSQLYPLPVIVTNPVSRIVAIGSNVTFSVSALGAPPLTYRWLLNGTNIPGATSTNLVLPNAQVTASGGYSAVVSNVHGAVSSAVATLTVGGAPTLRVQPVSQTVIAGTDVSFTASASGSLPLSFRFRKNPGGINLTNMILNQTNATYTIANVQPVHAGNYTVVVTNLFGTTPLSSNAILTVLIPPFIITPPTNRTANAGDSVTFTVGAGGTGPLVYQWRFNATNVLATFTNSLSPSTNSLALSNLTAAAAGAYTVVISITNNFASITSQVATLTIGFVDSDNDGLPDDWEIAHGLDPFSNVGGNGALGDPDHDGMSNLDEYLSGTDPQNPDSVLRVTLLAGGGGGALIKFTAMPNLTYTVQYRTNVNAGAWRSLTNLAAQSGTNLMQIIDPNAGASGRRFYRIATPLQP